jgi:hypothetical protein
MPFPSLLRVLAACLCLLVAAPAQKAAPQPPKPGQAVAILFVGNSYTQVNDLPAFVRALGRAETPPREITTTMLTPGGCTLQKHWETSGDDAPRTVLAKARPDFVVLQEQSRMPLDDDKTMQTYAAKFCKLARDKKVVPVLYMTWARATEPDLQDRISAQYELAQKNGGALLAPVGRAWQRVLATEAPLVLHAEDGSHPNPRGTYLAACVLHATMCGGDVRACPDKLVLPDAEGKGTTLIDLPDEEGRRLRDAAAAVLAGARVR